MQLLMSPPSPYARKARVLIREANLMDVVNEVEVSTTPMSSAAEILAANPTGKIPALVRSEGPAIYDSRVITRFLDDHAGAGLYPASRLWEILTLEATADAIMDASVGIIYEQRFREPDMQHAGWLDAQWGKAARGLSAINDRWMSHLEGPLNIGQIGVGCALGYLDLRHDDKGWRAQVPALAAWYEGFSARQSMVDTKPA